MQSSMVLRLRTNRNIYLHALNICEAREISLWIIRTLVSSFCTVLSVVQGNPNCGVLELIIQESQTYIREYYSFICFHKNRNVDVAESPNVLGLITPPSQGWNRWVKTFKSDSMPWQDAFECFETHGHTDTDFIVSGCAALRVPLRSKLSSTVSFYLSLRK